jgi:hypothetical protein
VARFEKPSRQNHFDISADGRRLLPCERLPQVPLSIRVAQNWFEGFRARRQGAREAARRARG